MTRVLIVNADDFGRTSGINRGIVRAHEHGIVTSASLMVRHSGAEEAGSYARTRRQLAVGLHVDVGEWRRRDNAWEAADEAAPTEEEVRRQLEAFRRLVGADPTHLDSHQHVHQSEPLLSILQTLAAELGVPLRHFDPRVRYVGDFYGQDNAGGRYPELISADALVQLVRGLEPGITELACHPGYADGLDSQYRAERKLELAALCDPNVRAAIGAERIELRSFRDAFS